MINIRFSHRYKKMPKFFEDTKLMQVLIVDRKELTKEFEEYDTAYEEGYMDKVTKYYELPKWGKLIILVLKTGNELWTTMRFWTPQKEEYYKSHVGEEVEIVLTVGI